MPIVIRTRCSAVFHKLPGGRLPRGLPARNLMQSPSLACKRLESGSQLALFHGVKRGFLERGREKCLNKAPRPARIFSDKEANDEYRHVAQGAGQRR
ncbi:hypothetical protein SM39_4531 [Serratia marcescens SM39]|uniref:Uncharacterized protein n=1 Tax=Serratia marcescens SM39 TaxID=1334564 RepID=A0AAT9F4S2_SERMA|nr:hypothetical protein SM39_4531 [Serratia marcescens SM39]